MNNMSVWVEEEHIEDPLRVAIHYPMVTAYSI